MSSTITIASIFILSLLLWLSYFFVFGEQPGKGETTIIAGFSTLCVFIVKGLINLLRRKENKA